jgi:hypothetical protein
LILPFKPGGRVGVDLKIKVFGNIGMSVLHGYFEGILPGYKFLKPSIFSSGD